MVDISKEELVELMASQPLALRKKITGTLDYSFIGDYDAANWVDGTAASRKEAVRKLMKEALASEATEEDVRLRIEGGEVFVHVPWGFPQRLRGSLPRTYRRAVA